MGRIILTPGGPRHPPEARAPAVRDEATVIIFLAVHSPSTPKVKVFPYTGSAYAQAGAAEPQGTPRVRAGPGTRPIEGL